MCLDLHIFACRLLAASWRKWRYSQNASEATATSKDAFTGSEKVKKETTFPAERVALRDDPIGGERFRSLSDELYPATYHTI